MIRYFGASSRKSTVIEIGGGVDKLCCTMLEGHTRRHYRGVPDSDQPDALIEYNERAWKGGPAWLLRTKGADFDCFIHHCPWCGTELAKLVL